MRTPLPLLHVARVALCAFAAMLLDPGLAAGQGDRDVVRQLEEREARRAAFARIEWVGGPATAYLGPVAEVRVPASCRVTDAEGSKQFMEATQNTADDSEVGILLCSNPRRDATWFVVFSFRKTGLIKDDEKATLDQAAILKTLQRGTDAGNQERRRRGWQELEIVGWQRPPYYDAVTHNLTWSTLLRVKGASSQSVNHSVRLLGRSGVMHADLVGDPADLASAVTVFDSILTTYEFVSGERYSEWREGDKVAAFGLTALVAGGAGVAAAKLGLFGKLWKFLLAMILAFKKLIVVAALAVVAILGKVFGTKEQEQASPPPPPRPPLPPPPARRPKSNLPPVVLRPAAAKVPDNAYPPAAAETPQPNTGKQPPAG